MYKGATLPFLLCASQLRLTTCPGNFSCTGLTGRRKVKFLHYKVYHNVCQMSTPKYTRTFVPTYNPNIRSNVRLIEHQFDEHMFPWKRDRTNVRLVVPNRRRRASIEQTFGWMCGRTYVRSSCKFLGLQQLQNQLSNFHSSCKNLKPSCKFSKPATKFEMARRSCKILFKKNLYSENLTAFKFYGIILKKNFFRSC